MKSLCYEQHWLMSDWLTDTTGLADRVFFNQPEIAWLVEQGYTPEFTKMADMQMEAMKYIIRFNIEDNDYLLLLLRWPNHIHKMDI